MRLTTKGRFAVTAMVDLAMRHGGGPVTLAEISQRQKISLSYLEQLFGKLRRRALVDSVRGPGGGYCLAKDMAQMSVADIILAVDEPIDATQCGGKENCHDDQKCITHDLWANLNQHIFDYLRRGHAEAAGRRAESQAKRRGAGARHARQPAQARAHHGLSLIAARNDARLFRSQRDDAARRAGAGGDAAVPARAIRQRVEPARVRHACARKAVNQAREQVAALVGVQPAQVIFTSGGTEANNAFIKGAAGMLKPSQIAVSAIEHPCVAKPAQELARAGWKVRKLAVDSDGRVDLADVRASAQRADRHGFGDARQQRNRRDPGRRRGRGKSARCARLDAYRRGAGAGQDRRRFQRAQRARDDAVGAQDLRPERRRRAGARQAHRVEAAHQRRRPRAGTAFRHRERAGHRRLRRCVRARRRAHARSCAAACRDARSVRARTCAAWGR